MEKRFSETRSELTLQGHIPALDGLRGLAVAAVFVLHYHPDETLGPVALQLLDRAALLGWAGVSLFFALSGFLITGILWDSLGQAHWWRNFYIRRSLRIFPLYYMVLCAVAVIAVVIGAPWMATAKIGFNFLYLSDVPWFWRQMFGFPLQSAMVHFWSLAVEEQFYLIWPFALLAYAKNRIGAMKLCVAIWIASLLFRVVAVEAGWSWLWPHHFLLSRAGELCAGALLALALRGQQESRERILRFAPAAFSVSLILLIVLLVTTPDLTLMAPGWSTVGVAVFSIFFCSMIALCLKPGVMCVLFENALLRWLGKISYGVYVYHLLFYDVFQKISIRLAPAATPLQAGVLLAAVGACGTLLIASLSYYTFECAFLLLKDRLTGTNSVVIQVPVTTEQVLSEFRS